MISGIYIWWEFVDIRTVRAGFWNTADLVMGAIMVVLIMEYTRKRHFMLFVLNIVLILYAVYGRIIPGMFYHPGLSWARVASAMSVETSTGVYSSLPQLALTVIGSFLLVLSVLRAFGCVDFILHDGQARRRALAARAAAIGGARLVRDGNRKRQRRRQCRDHRLGHHSGHDRRRHAAGNAAAIETASSLGGQLMPPVMGISAFLMADFLGVSYFDVVARGYVPAIIYYVSVSLTVYLLAIRYRVGGKARCTSTRSTSATRSISSPLPLSSSG